MEAQRPHPLPYLPENPPPLPPHIHLLSKTRNNNSISTYTTSTTCKTTITVTLINPPAKIPKYKTKNMAYPV